MVNPVVRAVYKGPGHEPFVAASTVDMDSTSSETKTTTPTPTEAKKEHLAKLRAALTEVQDDVNRQLTARMVQDAQDATAQKEEANYGEEVAEE